MRAGLLCLALPGGSGWFRWWGKETRISPIDCRTLRCRLYGRQSTPRDRLAPTCLFPHVSDVLISRQRLQSCLSLCPPVAGSSVAHSATRRDAVVSPSPTADRCLPLKAKYETAAEQPATRSPHAHQHLSTHAFAGRRRLLHSPLRNIAVHLRIVAHLSSFCSQPPLRAADHCNMPLSREPSLRNWMKWSSSSHSSNARYDQPSSFLPSHMTDLRSMATVLPLPTLAQPRSYISGARASRAL